jgi:transposase
MKVNPADASKVVLPQNYSKQGKERKEQVKGARKTSAAAAPTAGSSTSATPPPIAAPPPAPLAPLSIAPGTTVYLHADNARVHTAELCTEFLKTTTIMIMPHPPYSPDLAPCDFALFGNLKRLLKGTCAQTEAELLSMVTTHLNAIDRRARISIFRNWITRLETVISTHGEFV